MNITAQPHQYPFPELSYLQMEIWLPITQTPMDFTTALGTAVLTVSGLPISPMWVVLQYLSENSLVQDLLFCLYPIP